MDNKELIWVEKEFAEKYKVLADNKNLNEQRIAALNEYIEGVCNAAKQEFKSNLESLEEDVAIYTGLNLQVRQAFAKAKDEALSASLALWDEYEKELPSVRDKINKIVKELSPLKDELTTINDLLGKIKTYDIERVEKVIGNIAALHGKEKAMFDFLIKNFKSE